jgi:hypothetical protein
MLFVHGPAGCEGGHRRRRTALLTRRRKPEKLYGEIDWTLLLMFVGLFIVVAGLRQPVLTPDMARCGRHVPCTCLVAGSNSPPARGQKTDA